MALFRRIGVVLALLSVPLLLALASQQLAEQPGPPELPGLRAGGAGTDRTPAPVEASTTGTPAAPRTTAARPAAPAPERAAPRRVRQIPAPPPPAEDDGAADDDLDDDAGDD